MTMALRPGLSFCLVDGQVVFLDLPADRYFGLSKEIETSFRRMVDGETLHEADRERLASLRAEGLLVEGRGCALPAPCVRPAVERTGLLDRPLAPPPAAAMASSLMALMRARATLALGGLAGAVRRLARRKADVSERPTAASSTIEGIVSGFVGAERYISRFEGCLWHAFALADRMLADRLSPQLVFGVQLSPFAAHCWVQHGPVLVNDRFDIVRAFTPILVV